MRLGQETLRPLGERRVRLTREPLGWSFAPDHSRLVLGSTARGARLRLIDLRAMRALGDVRVADRGSGIATSWAGPRRVLAVVVTPGCCGAGDTIVAGVDTRRRRVVWRRTLGGSLQAGERWRRGLLLVLGPRSRSIGPSRLVRVGPRGGIRSTSLREIRSGSAPHDSVTHSWNPGLAVDRSGARAFIVQADAPLAEVDLLTFGVRSHPLERAARAADAVVGPTRHALWLGRGLLAVTGFDSHSSGTIRPGSRWSTHAAGVLARSTRAPPTLRSSPAHCSHRLSSKGGDPGAAHRLLAARNAEIPPLRERSDLGRATDRSERAGGRTAYSALIEARTGRKLRRYRRFTTSVLAGDAPFHY